MQNRHKIHCEKFLLRQANKVRAVIMLKRKVLPQIEEWYQGGCRKALLLSGARQVGKTTAVREFAKSHYTHFVEVNFVKRPIAQKAFDGDLDTKTIITNLSAILPGGNRRDEMLKGYEKVRQAIGKPGAPQHAASIILDVLRR